MGKGQDLLDAARKGDVEKLVALISKRSGPFPSLRRGAGVNVQDDKGFTPLHLACLQQHKEIVRLLLSVDASPCIVDKAGATPLHYAAFNGNPDIVAMLLTHTTPPVNVNHQTINLETPLLMAAPFGHVEVVQQLMTAGADVTLKNVKNETALDLAAQFGRTEVVRLLLRACPKLIDPYRHPNSTKQVFNNTPLHRASINGHKSIVSLLIEAGVDPNVSTGEGTPLHEAARFYRASVVRALLQHGADVRARARDGGTVLDMLAGQSQEASRRVRNVIREFETTEDEPPCFPVSPTYPVAGTKAPDTQKSTNKIDSFLSPSSSSLTKKHPQSFVKKLAQKCLGFKSKFNSAPNICNTSGLESVGDVKYKHSDQKISTNTLHIGNSKFFKMLLKKEESGEINCTDEFDTISLDRLGTLNRDSVVNRSNRSCPGFKTSLPDIYENTEISESHDSLADSVIVKSDAINEQNKNSKITEAVNYNTKLSIFEPREISAVDFKSNTNTDCANFINECYESCEISSKNGSHIDSEQNLSPKPSPRPLIIKNSGKDVLYENVNTKPTPATRTHVPSKNRQNYVERNVLYENVVLKEELKPHPLKRTVITSEGRSDHTSRTVSSSSISSSASSDSMIDESNLEDILISEKSKSFKHGQKITLFDDMKKSEVCRTQSNASILSDISDVTQASALENVDCSEDVSEQNMRLSTTGTLPNKKPERLVKKKVLFRHKTFTNIEVDRNSLPKWNGSITKETLANYHIRGTGHCIFKAPTVLEFINMFNKESLYSNVQSTSVASNTKRDSYFETVICFCKLKPPKHHLSAEDLEVHKEEAKASIDTDALKNRLEIKSTSFSCYCDVGTCRFHSTKRASPGDLVVKFSAVKRSISTPDITLETSPSSTELRKIQLTRKKSVPYKLETPLTLSKVNEIVKTDHSENKDAFRDRSVSYQSTISSTSSRPYSIKDIADVISLNSTSSADPNLTCASGKQLPLRKTSSSEYSGQWSLQSCDSNVTIKSDASYKTCLEESSDDGSDGSEGTLQSDGESSDAETVTSDASTTRRPWVSSGSFRFEHKEHKFHNDVIMEEENNGTLGETNSESYAKFESGISVGSESSSSACETDGGIPRVGSDVSLGIASLERGSGAVAGVRSGSGRRRWEEAEGTSEGDALSVSSAASSCAAHHLGHHLEYSKVSPTPPKKPPRRNLSVSPTHANSPSSGYSYELRTHARSQDDLDDIQGPKIYLKHGRSVDQYVDGKLSYSEYEENHNSPRIIPVPNPRSSLKNRTQPVAITAMYENVVIREQNPRRKLKRNNFGPQHDSCDPRMNENRVRKYSNQERSSLESLLDSQSMNSPSDCERYYEGHKVDVPSSPTHYEQPPTPDHPPPSAKQAENSIHERIRPLSQLIMEVVEEIRIRKKSQGDISGNS